MILKENSPMLETTNLILRKFEYGDIEDMVNIYCDRDVNKFLPWFVLNSKSEVENYLKEVILPYYSQEVGYNYAIILKKTGKAVGYIVLNGIDIEQGCGDIGYAIAKKYWNQNIVTEAGRILLERLRDMGYRFITATHDVNNIASGKVMEKLGMKYCYTYQELWQPKNYLVYFRLYQINFDKSANVFDKYWNAYDIHFIENL